MQSPEKTCQVAKIFFFILFTIVANKNPAICSIHWIYFIEHSEVELRPFFLIHYVEKKWGKSPLKLKFHLPKENSVFFT